MAKDDYFVIVYKILSYLYVKLKSGEDVNPNMITHDNQLLQINRKYITQDKMRDFTGI